MSEVVAKAPAPAPAADDEEKPVNEQDVIRASSRRRGKFTFERARDSEIETKRQRTRAGIFKGFKRDAQMIISKVSELEYEVGEHELVLSNVASLAPDRTAYRLIGGVLVKTTIADTKPKVEDNMANIRSTIGQLKKALANVNEKSAAWKEKYAIRTQQELELERRAQQAAGGPGVNTAAPGVLA